jgi:hypothetical protein
MAKTRPARPARKPAGATRASTKAPVKRLSAKKTSKPKSAAIAKNERAAWPHGAIARDDLPPATCIALVERITRAVERELSQIEAIVAGYHVEPALRSEAERRARTLGSLAHTLTEVRKLRADEDKSKAGYDDAGPEDINTFRLELAQKLDRLVAESQVLYPGEADGAGER